MFSVSRYVVAAVLALLTTVCSAAATLRVCADPNNMPYSNRQQQGFENHLAQMIAQDMGMNVSYVWYRQGGKFFQRTLDANVCDVVMGVPAGLEDARSTQPYYVSSYAFLSRRDRHLHITSLDDPQLRRLKIGVHILGDMDDNVPPVDALIKRGIVHNLVGFSIFGNLAETNPSADLIRAVVSRKVDVAVVWGPLAGYFAHRSRVPLVVTPITGDPGNPALPMVFGIGIGVRPQDTGLRSELNTELERRRPQIQALLASYGIPQVGAPAAVEGGN